jgi:voltage-gated potassium channel
MRRIKPFIRIKKFIKDIYTHTPFVKMVLLLTTLLVLFTLGIYLAERGTEGAVIKSYGDALYWGIAAFSTAGIADTPTSSLAMFIGGAWIIIGSILFFGAIVATVTTYFVRPMQRPHKQIIDTVEYNLEQLDDLTIDELSLLKETINTLIVHVEKLKVKQAKQQQKFNE